MKDHAKLEGGGGGVELKPQVKNNGDICKNIKGTIKTSIEKIRLIMNWFG